MHHDGSDFSPSRAGPSYVEGLYNAPGGLGFLSRILSPSPTSRLWQQPPQTSPVRGGLPPQSSSGPSSSAARATSQSHDQHQHRGTPIATGGTPVHMPADFSTPGRQTMAADAHARHPQDAGKPMWSLRDFDLGPKLGEGRFGKIYLARERETHAAVVLKCISKEAVARTGLVDQLRREIELQHQLGRRTRRVTRLYAYFWDDTTIFLVLEHAEGGDMRAALDAAGGSLPERDAAASIADVATGLSHLHEHGVAHRDIKPENILVRKGRCKIADFTWVAECRPRQRRNTVCGTLDYLPPEVVRQEDYGLSVDLWCLGVLCYELLVGRPPFEHPQSTETCRAILEGNLAFPSHVAADARSLIHALLQQEPSKRLSAAEVLQHPWIQRCAGGGGTEPHSPFLSSLRRARRTVLQASAVGAGSSRAQHAAADRVGSAYQQHQQQQQESRRDDARDSDAYHPASSMHQQRQPSHEVSRALDMSDDVVGGLPPPVSMQVSTATHYTSTGPSRVAMTTSEEVSVAPDGRRDDSIADVSAINADDDAVDTRPVSAMDPPAEAASSSSSTSSASPRPSTAPDAGNDTLPQHSSSLQGLDTTLEMPDVSDVPDVSAI